MSCGHSVWTTYELREGLCPTCWENENEDWDEDDYECNCIDTSMDNEGVEICNECGRCVGK